MDAEKEASAVGIKRKRGRPRKPVEPPPRKEPKVYIFLDAYRRCGNVVRSAEAAGIDPKVHYRRLRMDAEYVRRFVQAQEEATSALRDEAVRRASEGVSEPVWYKGRKCGTVQRYSDSLMMFLLRGLQPEVFGNKATVQHTGPDGGPVKIDPGLAILDDDELEWAIRIRRKLASSGDAGSGAAEEEKEQD